MKQAARFPPTQSAPGARPLRIRESAGLGPHSIGSFGLPAALDAERLASSGLSCYVAGDGPPLILVHSVNAAASAAEVRPIFEHYRATRTVFALDLPGFGFSDRSDRPYTPRLMTDAIHALVATVRKRMGKLPVDGLACSLGCEFLARAAVESPEAWGRLALVSPTGLNGVRARGGPPGSTAAKPWLHALLSAAPWSEALYRGLTRPAVIRYFLERTWGSKAIDEVLWAYDVRTARFPGARFAPLHFLSGSLFSRDIHAIYEAMPQAVWMGHGTRGDFSDFRAMAQLRIRDSWHIQPYPAGALPYFEVPQPFFASLDGFLGTGHRDAATVAT